MSLQSCPTLCHPMDYSLLCPGDFPGKNTVVGCHALLQGSSQPRGQTCISYVSCIGCCCCCQVASVMSNSVQPHRWQPTRLPHPWDSPGSNSGVGCHFLLQCMTVKSESEVPQLCPTPRDPMDCSPPGSSVHGISQARVLEWGAIVFSACIGRWVLYH